MDDFYPERENFLLQNRNCRQKNVEGNAPPVLICLFALSFAVQFPAESAKSGREKRKAVGSDVHCRNQRFLYMRIFHGIVRSLNRNGEPLAFA